MVDVFSRMQANEHFRDEFTLKIFLGRTTVSKLIRHINKKIFQVNEIDY